VAKQKKAWEEVIVLELPPCDICEIEGAAPQLARYDGRTRSGRWAYMCEHHFRSYGIGLGLGRGQKLVVERMVKKERC